MRTEDFDFDLPRALIAQRPASPRDSARLLAVRDELVDHRVADLPALLAPGDLLVANDTRVIPARLAGRRGEAAVEVTLHKLVGGALWHAFARPARKLKEGDRIDFAPELAATVAAKRAGGEVVLDFALPPDELLARLERVGAMPLPPYIKRPEGPEAADLGDYQTVFAAEPGAVAAPTAGLHFTSDLLDALVARGIGRVALTLHVGAGTFLPVKVEDPRDHEMHLENGQLSEAAATAINAARAAGGRIVAIGTTALRLLEAAAAEDGTVEPFAGETGIYILPGYRFRAVDLLFTNFHLPRSTLFMLVCAFAGRARMLRAYEHAKSAGYRFFSYGDSCLLWPEHRP